MLAYLLQLILIPLFVSSEKCIQTPLPYSGKTARVLGAGVIGLTNAIMLQRVGFSVTIHAKTGPYDYNPVTDSDPYYTSAKAGAWIPGDGTDVYWEATFDAFTGYNRTYPLAGVGIFETHDYFGKEVTPQEIDEYTPFKNYAKQYKLLSEEYLDHLRFPNGSRMFPAGVSWLSPIVVPLQYLKTLMTTFIQQGGVYVHENVEKISDLTRHTDIVVISPGIGARTLGELMDTGVIPEKGQIVIMQQPADVSQKVTIARWVDFWPEMTYILPRLNGEIVLGGTSELYVDNFIVSPTVRQAIIERTTWLEPKLRGLTVLRDVVGIRPARVEEEPRIEIELNSHKFRVPVIYAYGHGGEGFEGSWGTALKVLELVHQLDLC